MPQVNLWAVLAAATSAFVAGGIWYAPALFERKLFELLLINGGYHTLQFTIYGAVLGLMP